MGVVTGGSGGGGGAISGVTVTGTAAASQVPVASSSSAGAWAYPPGFEIGYDQITATVTVASTTESAGTTIITCGAHTFDGAPVMAEFFSPVVDVGSTAGDFVCVCLFEASTEIGELGLVETGVSLTSGNLNVPFTGKLRFTPSAASHTYTVTAFKGGTSPTAHVQAGVGGTGANVAAFIRFTKV